MDKKVLLGGGVVGILVIIITILIIIKIHGSPPTPSTPSTPPPPPSTPASTPSTPPPLTVTATLKFASDLSSIPENSVARTTFETNFKTDVAAEIGVTAGQIFITSIRDGSVVVEFEVTSAEEGTAAAISTAFASGGVSIAGFTTMHGVESVTTTEGGLASPPPPTPPSTPASTPEASSCNGGLTIENSSTVCSGVIGDTCQYTCDAGYTEAGTHICGTDGIFTGGSCEPANCENIALTNPTHGHYDCQSGDTVEHGGICTLTCDSGYTVAGSTPPSCNRGVLSESNMTCEPENCENIALTNPTHGHYDCQPGDTVEHGGICTLTCENGYTVTGSTNPECNRGVLSESDMTCSPANCENIALTNPTHGHYDCQPGDTVEHGGICTLTCENGYTITGSTNPECNLGVFSEGNMTCDQDQCNPQCVQPPQGSCVLQRCVIEGDGVVCRDEQMNDGSSCGGTNSTHYVNGGSAIDTIPSGVTGTCHNGHCCSTQDNCTTPGTSCWDTSSPAPSPEVDSKYNCVEPNVQYTIDADGVVISCDGVQCQEGYVRFGCGPRTGQDPLYDEGECRNMKPLEATCVMDDGTGTVCMDFTPGDPSSCPDNCTYTPSLCVSNLGSTDCGLPQHTQLANSNWVNSDGPPELQCTFNADEDAPIWDSDLGEYKDPVSGTNRDVNQICPGPNSCEGVFGTCTLPDDILDVDNYDPTNQCMKDWTFTPEERDALAIWEPGTCTGVTPEGDGVIHAVEEEHKLLLIRDGANIYCEDSVNDYCEDGNPDTVNSRCGDGSSTIGGVIPPLGTCSGGIDLTDLCTETNEGNRCIPPDSDCMSQRVCEADLGTSQQYLLHKADGSSASGVCSDPEPLTFNTCAPRVGEQRIIENTQEFGAGCIIDNTINPSHVDATACVSAGGVWIHPPSWTGECTHSDATVTVTTRKGCGTCSAPANNTKYSCENDGGTWSFGSWVPNGSTNIPVNYTHCTIEDSAEDPPTSECGACPTGKVACVEDSIETEMRIVDAEMYTCNGTWINKNDDGRGCDNMCQKRGMCIGDPPAQQQSTPYPGGKCNYCVTSSGQVHAPAADATNYYECIAAIEGSAFEFPEACTWYPEIETQTECDRLHGAGAWKTEDVDGSPLYSPKAVEDGCGECGGDDSNCRCIASWTPCNYDDGDTFYRRSCIQRYEVTSNASAYIQNKFSPNDEQLMRCYIPDSPTAQECEGLSFMCGGTPCTQSDAYNKIIEAEEEGACLYGAFAGNSDGSIPTVTPWRECPTVSTDGSWTPSAPVQVDINTISTSSPEIPSGYCDDGDVGTTNDTCGLSSPSDDSVPAIICSGNDACDECPDPPVCQEYETTPRCSDQAQRAAVGQAIIDAGSVSAADLASVCPPTPIIVGAVEGGTPCSEGEADRCGGGWTGSGTGRVDFGGTPGTCEGCSYGWDDAGTGCCPEIDRDCANICSGSSLEDTCGVCDTDPTNDCGCHAGSPNPTLDDCGICSNADETTSTGGHGRDCSGSCSVYSERGFTAPKLDPNGDCCIPIDGGKRGGACGCTFGSEDNFISDGLGGCCPPGSPAFAHDAIRRSQGPHIKPENGSTCGCGGETYDSCGVCDGDGTGCWNTPVWRMGEELDMVGCGTEIVDDVERHAKVDTDPYYYDWSTGNGYEQTGTCPPWPWRWKSMESCDEVCERNNMMCISGDWDINTTDKFYDAIKETEAIPNADGTAPEPGSLMSEAEVVSICGPRDNPNKYDGAREDAIGFRPYAGSGGETWDRSDGTYGDGQARRAHPGKYHSKFVKDDNNFSFPLVRRRTTSGAVHRPESQLNLATHPGDGQLYPSPHKLTSQANLAFDAVIGTDSDWGGTSAWWSIEGSGPGRDGPATSMCYTEDAQGRQTVDTDANPINCCIPQIPTTEVGSWGDFLGREDRVYGDAGPSGWPGSAYSGWESGNNRRNKSNGDSWESNYMQRDGSVVTSNYGTSQHLRNQGHSSISSDQGNWWNTWASIQPKGTWWWRSEPWAELPGLDNKGVPQERPNHSGEFGWELHDQLYETRCRRPDPEHTQTNCDGDCWEDGDGNPSRVTCETYNHRRRRLPGSGEWCGHFNNDTKQWDMLLEDCRRCDEFRKGENDPWTWGDVGEFNSAWRGPETDDGVTFIHTAESATFDGAGGVQENDEATCTPPPASLSDIDSQNRSNRHTLKFTEGSPSSHPALSEYWSDCSSSWGGGVNPGMGLGPGYANSKLQRYGGLREWWGDDGFGGRVQNVTMGGHPDVGNSADRYSNLELQQNIDGDIHRLCLCHPKKTQDEWAALKADRGDGSPFFSPRPSLEYTQPGGHCGRGDKGLDTPNLGSASGPPLFLHKNPGGWPDTEPPGPACPPGSPFNDCRDWRTSMDMSFDEAPETGTFGKCEVDDATMADRPETAAMHVPSPALVGHTLGDGSSTWNPDFGESLMPMFIGIHPNIP